MCQIKYAGTNPGPAGGEIPDLIKLQAIKANRHLHLQMFCSVKGGIKNYCTPAFFSIVSYCTHRFLFYSLWWHRYFWGACSAPHLTYWCDVMSYCIYFVYSLCIYFYQINGFKKNVKLLSPLVALKRRVCNIKYFHG